MSEGVYLIHPREFIKTNENVYKLGRSIHLDNRVKQYPNGSKIGIKNMKNGAIKLQFFRKRK